MLKYICIISLFFAVWHTNGQTSITEAQNNIIGTWYQDFSKYSDPQNIIEIDDSFKIVYDENNVYYYEGNQLVDETWYEIRTTGCNGNSSNNLYLVTPDAITGEDRCSIIYNITDDLLILAPEGRSNYFRYVKE